MASTTASPVTKRCKSEVDGCGIATLPDELLVEVFSRVGSVKALFLFAVTSRRWLRLFTDPAFLRHLCPGHGEGHGARILGFVPRQKATYFVGSPIARKRRMAQRTSVSPPTFLPAPGSPLGPTERALTSFVADDDGTFNYAQPLAARRGVVLMQLVPRTFDDLVIEDTTCWSFLLGLWNPTTCERHVLPPLERSFSLEYGKGYAIVMAADVVDLAGFPPQQQTSSPSGRFTFSQLLVITTQPRSRQMYLHSYSAATGRWSAPTWCLDGRRFSLVRDRPATVHRGAAHWLCSDKEEARTRAPPRDEPVLYKLSVELGTTRVSLTKLPIRAGGTTLLHVNRDGKLSVACVYPAHATVWTTQQDDGEEDAWVRTRVVWIPMAVPNPKYAPELPLWLEWYEFDRGLVLALDEDGGIFVLNLEKEVTMEKVMECTPSMFKFNGNWCRGFVPYELDLVEFFESHLGGLLRRGG